MYYRVCVLIGKPQRIALWYKAIQQCPIGLNSFAAKIFQFLKELRSG